MGTEKISCRCGPSQENTERNSCLHSGLVHRTRPNSSCKPPHRKYSSTTASTHRLEQPILLLAMLVIAGLEIFIMIVQYLPQKGIGGLSWVVNWHIGRHEKPLVREGRAHSPPAPMPDVLSHCLSSGEQLEANRINAIVYSCNFVYDW